ncbi:hypothetical protein F8271_26085 [Micromonospora sp. ALFpr18c]|uniref:hypothetical protein n=1 Tax=unclassified Micromonospora TaxID=2617518 RepID=UPI00124BBCB3|nr:MULTISPECIES: hypothetical protein [unclassified Micromonospora]KAB1931880.1 hypothetical protein F8271_26085 [Micromonospora sp. ALFpr18c]MDG4762181.1 hypothetical protein [Micromonospora sp. WMMD710]
MPVELSDLYRSLSTVADDQDPTHPELVRRYADRRARVRAAGTGLTVALLLGGVAVGGRLVLAADGTPPLPPPADTPGPTATGSVTPPSPTPSATSSSATSTPSSVTPTRTTPSGTPPAPTTGAATPRPPTSIPDRAFFVLAAANRTGMESQGEGAMLPILCGARHASDSAVVQRRGRYLAYKLAGTPAGNVPDGSYRHTITIYRPGRADDALRELRQAVRDCPDQRLPDDTRTWRQRLLTSGAYGDESVLFEMRAPYPEGMGDPGAEEVRLVRAVRIGDVVTVLWEQGWEHTAAVRSQVDADSRRAVAAIENWLD